MLAITIIWWLEVAFVQEYTLEPRFVRWFSWIGKHGIRWGISFFCILFVLAFFRKRLVFFFMFSHLLYSTILITYFQYFGYPLSEQVVFSQASEGGAVLDYALQLVDAKIVVSLTTLLVLKIYLYKKLYLNKVVETSPLLSRWAAYGCGSCIAISLLFMPSFSSVGSWGSWKIFGEVYGYLPAWAINGVYCADSERLLNLVMASTEVKESSKITGIDPFPPKTQNIVIIQVESLDYSILFKKTQQGEYVTPFINKISKKALFYKAFQSHTFGSAGADFQMLTCRVPTRGRIPYKVEGYPFSTLKTLPRVCKSKGFHSAVFHGNYGYFYNRRLPFIESGFDEIFFIEDIKNGAVPKCKGYVLDGDLFQFSLNKIIKKRKNLHFIITITSHGPWRLLPDSRRKLVDNMSDMFPRYVNSINYVDKSLEKYVSDLPDGTVLIIYGDHSSGIQYEGSEDGMVPFIIYCKGTDLSKGQMSNCRNNNLGKGSLNFSDLVKFVYDYIDSMDEHADPAT